MPETPFEKNVFINCPFDAAFGPLLEAMIFCVVRAGLTPRLATERLEASENRLDKIVELIGACKFSIHDLSLSTASKKGESFRMNMPFELGLDLGFRRVPNSATSDKKFIIFEKNPYDLKRCLSDLAGADVDFHRDDFMLVIEKLRNFLVVEARRPLPGPSAIQGDYITFQGWMVEKKISEGLTEKEALRLPTTERLAEMSAWMTAGRPDTFPVA